MVFYIPLPDHRYQVVENPQQKEEQKSDVAKTEAPKTLGGNYEKIVLEGKTYYKQGDKYYKASVNDNGEITYNEVGTLGK